MRWYRRRGQSLVEFALILPVLVMVFFLIIDGAFLVQGVLTVNHVAREAARFATMYQPPLGECITYKVGGVAQSGYPFCGGGNESEDAYYERRVALIKRVARDRTKGLRITIVCDGFDSNDCVTTNRAVSGMWGVRVWGIHDFNNPTTLPDMPGLPGLPVQVQVVHRVPLVAASLFMAQPSVLVQGTSQMVNEGVQTMGDGAPPPVILPPPPIEPPKSPPPLVSPYPSESPTASPTTQLPPVVVVLTPETALNTLPMEREHKLVATVTSDGQPLPGMMVKFTTDNGSFAYSGSSLVRTKYVETDIGGIARVSIYTNEPTVAHIEAWADGGVVGLKENSEFDTAVKTWIVVGPYLIVSDHNPEAGDVIAVHLRDHDPNVNPHSLWWCPNLTDPNTVPIAVQVDAGINVDGGGDISDRPILVPATAMGTYYLESHSSGPGGCGNAGDFAARSADIKIKLPNPDLRISNVQILGPVEAKRAPGVPLTLTVSVENLQPVNVTTGPFDIDVYPNLDEPPYRLQLSTNKQWLATMGPNETVVLTYVVEIEDVGTNHLWAQVDTTNYIEEEDETNNIFGPVDFEACVGSDDFDAGMKSVWATGKAGDANGSATVNGNGELSVINKGSGFWNSPDNYFFVYQNYPGDFDARLRIISPPRRTDYSKIGLHVRAALNTTSPHVMNMAMNRTSGYNPASSQAGYRTGTNATRLEDDRVINLPYWVRIVRKGSTYALYSSEAVLPNSAGDWRSSGSTTIATAMPYIGIAHGNYNWQSPSEGIVDDFMICPSEFTLGPSGGGGGNPPGLIECEELLNVRGFEGNNTTVFSYWHAGNVGAFRLTSQERYRGNFSMRLHASLGAYPCSQNSLQPELYQDIQIPTTVYSISQLLVTGHYYVDGSDMECSNPNSPDPDDTLSLKLLDAGGSVIAPPATVINGGVVSQTWHTVATTITAATIEDYAGDTVRLQWNGNHTGDYDGTYFYLDDLSAQMCTIWPIPDPEDGTVSLGGKLTTQISGGTLRVALTGADVWAYTQNGEIYHTTSIQDGTYHFYNLPEPGTYIIYSEATVDGQLRTAVATVTLAASERNYNINMFLQ